MSYLRLSFVFLFLCLGQSCVFHSHATEWNGRVGPDGKPVKLTSTTKVGLKFLVALPFLGNMEIGGLVDDITRSVKEDGGDKVRVFQAASENYWYGFPPFTWILTPVISTVAAEYEAGPPKTGQ
ncbi:MAG: hypothetical protein H6837_12080 [Planctomycetes bacterium]|nr:hypothetical protein [Planctomycetota bacterium]